MSIRCLVGLRDCEGGNSPALKPRVTTSRAVPELLQSVVFVSKAAAFQPLQVTVQTTGRQIKLQVTPPAYILVSKSSVSASN